MKITLIRHGKSEGNTKGRYIGFTDEPLCDTADLNLNYPKAHTIIISDMRRAVMTAEYIYPKARLIPCIKLRECNFGEFENKSYEDLKSNGEYIRWISERGKTAPYGGESNSAFKKRCIEGFYESVEYGGDKAVFVIHGGTIMAIMQRLFGGDFYDYQIRCGGMFSFEYDREEKRAVGDYIREE